MDRFVPCLTVHRDGSELNLITLGHPLLDDYLAFVAARARMNTWLAVASYLKIFFFGVVGKPPSAVATAEVFGFLSAQRAPRRGEQVVRLDDGETGLAARTIARRLSSVRGLYALAARADTDVARNPVPTSLAARRPGRRRGSGGVALIRTPRTLPRVLSPGEVDALVGALRTHRDRAIVAAMVLGGRRRCEMLGLRLGDVNAGERRLFIAEGKGGRQRMVPVSTRFFTSLAGYMEQERPPTSTTERLFVVLKGPRRGQALSAAGVDEILDGARGRAGLSRATCHQLRHTCFTRLREAGMALRAIQAQAGHASIESTRIPASGQGLVGEGVSARGRGDRGAVQRARRGHRRDRAVSRSRARRPEIEALVDAYRNDLLAAGMFAENPVTSVACTFFTRVGVEGWSRLSLAQQCALPLKDRRVLGWLLVTGRVRPSADYLVACRPYLGQVAAHHHRVFHARFAAASADLGFEPLVTRLQWSALAKVAALAGVSPEQLTAAKIQAGRDALVAAIARHRPDSHGTKALSAALFGAQTTLFHLGVLDIPPRKTNRDRSAERAAAWASAPPQLAATITGYIAQTRLSLRASTMVRVEGVLREFGGWLTLHTPDVGCVADLCRRHIEAYRLHLAARPSARGGNLTKTPLRALRTCFERLTERNGDDVPSTVFIFAGDLPLREDSLPRFLVDGAFTKLLQTTRADPDPFVRLAVEFLARTGLHKGEFLDLTLGSMVQIGSAYWLHVPPGKLRTDRYIPLHPQLKQLLDDWVADRPRILGSPWLFIEHGQRIRHGRVDRAVAKAAQTAGIGHVNPYRLRHTLATQAIKRGMSLEAIAALLGHRSMRMTLVYARIAHRTVADEYFAVSEKVEELYDAPRQLPHDAEGTEMRRLQAEMHRRMLGNGYCARPVGLDCHFESICESCIFFQTTIEFRPTRQRRRDDAADKGQLDRQKVFNGLLARLEVTAS